MELNIRKAELAVSQLLLAYAKAKDGGSVEWEDLDLAVEYAKDAMPGLYERILEELEESDATT